MKHATFHSALIFLTLLCAGISTKAQQSISINSDSLWANDCPLPATISGYIYGSADNYNSAIDSVSVEFFWGDGTSTTDTVELIESGTTDYWNANAAHNYTLTGVYHVMVVATMPNNLADTFYWNDSVNAAPGCTSFTGNIYEDQNNNCIYNSSVDDPIWSAIIKVTDANGQVVAYDWSDYNGYYDFSLPNNLTNLTITASRFPAYTVECPTAGSYTFNTTTSQVFDFGMVCDSMDLDKQTYLWGYADSPGDTGFVSFSGWARHCVAPVGPVQDTMILTLDTNLSYVGMSNSFVSPPNVVNGNTLTWYFTWQNYNSFQSLVGNSSILIETDTSLNMMDTVCFDITYASLPSNDIDPTNNQTTICWPVGVPYDPNNKLATPQGVGPLGKIDTSVHRLTYRINFQNTGSAPAEDVYVLDTIPSELNIETIDIIESSHPMKLIYQNNNRVRFDFPNINLADSASDEEGSKGYVTFTINRDPNLAVGTQIKNRVGIYFDYQAPVVTEYAINTLYIAPIVPDDPDSLVVAFEASDVTCLENNNGSIVLDILSGNPPYTYAWNDGSTANERSNLAPGTYSVTVTDAEQLGFTTSITVEENRVHPAPVVGELTGQTSVQSWQSYIYTVDATAGSSFVWNAIGGEVTNTASNQAEILWYGGPEGQIQITKIDENGCTGEESFTVPIVFLGTEETRSTGLSIYPNPADDQIRVELPKGMENATITIHDVQGRIIAQEKTNTHSHMLSLTDVQAGVYWIRVSDEGSSYDLKMIIAH